MEQAIYDFTPCIGFTHVAIAGERVLVLFAKSPIVAPRDGALAAFGKFVTFYGACRYELVGIERKLPGRPIAVGEIIGLAVRPIGQTRVSCRLCCDRGRIIRSDATGAEWHEECMACDAACVVSANR